MATPLTGYGLLCLWGGAMALGGVVVLRQKRPVPPPAPPVVQTPKDGNASEKAEREDKAALVTLDWSSPAVRKTVETTGLITGAAALIVGLGLLGLGALH